MTDPTPPTPEALVAALRLVLLAADYAASDRYYTQGYRPDGAAEPEELRGLIALVEDNLPAMATGPELLAALRPFAEVFPGVAGLQLGPSGGGVTLKGVPVETLQRAYELVVALDAGEATGG